MMEVTQLVIMPHWAFHRLAEQIGDPKFKEVGMKGYLKSHSANNGILQVVVLHYPARSGSTLLCQIFHRLPNTAVFSDPCIHYYLNKYYQLKLLNNEECSKLVKSTMRLLLKPKVQVCDIIFAIFMVDFLISLQGPNDRVMVKFAPFVAKFWPDMQNAFPSFKYMFNVRHPQPCLKSWINMMEGPLLSPIKE